MSEPNNEPTNTVDAAELVTLRKLRDELLQSKHTQKARISALESQVLQLTEERNTAQATVRAVVIDQPLKVMASLLNKNVPELVLRELREDYEFDAAEDGAIVMKAKADGALVKAKDGKAVVWDRASLYALLTGADSAEKSDRQRMYQHLLGVPIGSGGVGRKSLSYPHANNPQQDKKDVSASFGLR